MTRSLWSVEFNRGDGKGWLLSTVYPKLADVKRCERWLRGCYNIHNTRIRKWRR